MSFEDAKWVRDRVREVLMAQIVTNDDQTFTVAVIRWGEIITYLDSRKQYREWRARYDDRERAIVADSLGDK